MLPLTRKYCRSSWGSLWLSGLSPSAGQSRSYEKLRRQRRDARERGAGNVDRDVQTEFAETSRSHNATGHTSLAEAKRFWKAALGQGNQAGRTLGDDRLVPRSATCLPPDRALPVRRLANSQPPISEASIYINTSGRRRAEKGGTSTQQ